jgi:hypothetical protein
MGSKEERARDVSKTKREVESVHAWQERPKFFSDNDPVNTDMCRNIYSSFLAKYVRVLPIVV